MANSKQDFVKLITEQQKLINKICHIYADNTEDRQDLFQEIVFQLWKSFSSFKGQAKLTTWMYRVGLNTAINTLRKKQPITDDINLAREAVESEDSINQTENKELLDNLIRSLSKVDKSLILLYLEDKSYEEIAEITGMSKSNISVRLVRIRKKLKELYKTDRI